MLVSCWRSAGLPATPPARHKLAAATTPWLSPASPTTPLALAQMLNAQLLHVEEEGGVEEGGGEEGEEGGGGEGGGKRPGSSTQLWGLRSGWHWQVCIMGGGWGGLLLLPPPRAARRLVCTLVPATGCTQAMCSSCNAARAMQAGCRAAVG